MVEKNAILRQTCSTVVAALGIFLTLACGATRNVIDHRSEQMAGEGGEGVTRPGGSGGGAGGTPGGSAGSPASAGHAGTLGGSTGTGGNAITWDAHDCHPTAVAEPSDATTHLQWAAARDYCAALGRNNCFESGVITGVSGCTSDQKVDACVAQALWFHQEVAPECEDAWRKDLECGAKATFGEKGCMEAYVVGLPRAPNDTCQQENDALAACTKQSESSQKVLGSYTSCSYSKVSGSSCWVSCPVGNYTATLTCSGPEGLPQQCGCQLNGHAVTFSDPVFVNDCADAARQAADGLCAGQLDCCFSYTDGKQQACMCADPATYGYDTCQAMITFAKGTRVDICPELLPDPPSGGCWPPGGCSHT